MPYESETQRRFFHAATQPGFRGDADISKKDVAKWDRETPKGKKLPERVKRTKKANLELAFELGQARAFGEASLEKSAGLEKSVGNLLGRTAPLWGPAAIGGVVAGPEHRTEGALAGLGLGILGKRIGRGALQRGIFKPHEIELAEKATKLGPESAELKNLIKSLGEHGEEFGKGVQTLRNQGPLADWGGRLAGGAVGGLGARELLSDKPGSIFQTNPAVSDISTHYTGLVPGEGYY